MRLCLILCLFFSQVQAQTLRGMVVDRSDDSAVLPDVKLTPLTGGDNYKITNSKGEFSFFFPGVKAGELIELMVEIEGYVLLGPYEKLCRVNMPNADDAELVKIAAVREEVYRNLEADYVGAIEKQLKRAEDKRSRLIARLSEATLAEDERRNLSATISQQSDEITKLRNSKEELAKRLAQIDLEAASEFARAALRKFQEEGDVNTALELMSAEKTDAFWENMLRQEEKIKQAREQGVENYMIRARLLETDLNFGEAKKSYLAALERDSTDFPNWFEAAYFLAKQRDFTKAITLNKYALRLSATFHERSNIFNNLGNLYFENQQMNEAEAAYDEAVDIRRELVKLNRKVYLSDLSASLNNLGLLYYATQRSKEAETAYDEAVIFRRELVKSNRIVYLPDLSTSLNNLGLLNQKNHRMKEAEAAYGEAVVLYRELVKTNRFGYLPNLASSLSNLGNFYSERQRMKEAEAVHNEAIAIFRELVKTNRLPYLPDLAKSLNNLGLLYFATQRSKEAEAVYDEAVAIFQELVKINQLYNLPDLAKSLINCGNLYRHSQRIEEAEISYNEAITILKELANTNRLAHLPDLGNSLYNLGNLYYESQRMNEAEATYEKAVAIFRELRWQNRLAYLPNLASSLYNLGFVYISSQRMKEAESAYVEVMEMYRELIKTDQIRYLANLASTLNKLGLISERTGYFFKAMKYYDESLNLYLEEEDKKSLGSKDGTRLVLGNLMVTKNLLIDRNDYEGIYEAGRIISNGWDKIQTFDKKYLPSAAQAKGELARYTLFAQKHPEALIAAKEALVLDPTQTWINTNLALAHLLNHNRKEAKAIYLEFKDQPYPQDESKTFRDIFLADLAELAAVGIFPEDYEEIGRWLE
ncbi:tetratricopeptide repeat protein [Neolewinella persica]|uniref:tetratricopeptide repeat protein n=1 Tax=Neolewinella persica TaxID=70998 RepID=UPI0003A9CF34|nr:tetratricopeptide repeat protein [Neolewinella persica]